MSLIPLALKLKVQFKKLFSSKMLKKGLDSQLPDTWEQDFLPLDLWFSTGGSCVALGTFDNV